MENAVQRDVILQLAAMSGEVSESAVMSLNCSQKYLVNLLIVMRNDNLIIRSDKDGTIGYRLSQSGKRYLKQTYPDRYSDYFGSGGIKNKVRLDEVHRQRYQRMSEVNALMCDGFADEKSAVLFACEFDMVRLVLFKTGIELRKLNGIVYCFDFQADVLRRFFGENVVLRTISLREIAGMIGK